MDACHRQVGDPHTVAHKWLSNPNDSLLGTVATVRAALHRLRIGAYHYIVNLLGALPPASFVPLTVPVLTTPEVIWRVADAPDLHGVSCLPVTGEMGASFGEETSVWHADRYGGTGVVSCGGSARCGLNAAYQIKGIGITPLWHVEPGEPVDPFHANGTVNLVEAAREAIWSEIYRRVLPFGAVRTLAIVLTGSRVGATYHDDRLAAAQATHRRALIIREHALRPGHFLRSMRFAKGRYASLDVARTKAALERLDDQLLAIDDSHHESPNRMSDALVAMAHRWAKQLAASLTLRLPHRGLGCSNIALDGRFLDFGASSAQPGFRRRAGAPAPAGEDPWEQHRRLVVTLRLLSSQAQSYLPAYKAQRLISSRELIEAFSRDVGHQYNVCLAALSGVPHTFLAQEADLALRFGAAAKAVALAGARKYAWRPSSDPMVQGLAPMPSLGLFDLSQLLRDLAQADDKALSLASNASFAARQHGPLVDTLRSAYHDVMARFTNVAGSHAAHEARQEAMRRNEPIDFLVRETLEAELTKRQDDPRDVAVFIDNTVSRAIHVCGRTFNEGASHGS